MSKSEQSTLILAITILILFVLNYFVTLPAYNRYNENIEEVARLDAEIIKLEQDIAQGAELSAAIEEVESSIRSIGIDEYYNENYSVHNFYVDTAEDFDINVTALSLSSVGTTSVALTEAGLSTIASHNLISGHMINEEINLVPAYYEVVSQNATMTVEGTIDDILDYADFLAKDDVYMVFPSLTLSDFIDNNGEVTMSIQFTEYSYRLASIDANAEIVL